MKTLEDALMALLVLALELCEMHEAMQQSHPCHGLFLSHPGSLSGCGILGDHRRHDGDAMELCNDEIKKIIDGKQMDAGTGLSTS